MKTGRIASALIALLFAATGCGGGDSGPDPDEVERLTRLLEEEYSQSEVLYEVEGTVAYADVTMQTPTGTRQETPDVPMTLKSGEQGVTYSFDPNEFVYISAQKKDTSGTITCRITVDGEVVSENTSTAAYGIASCKGRS
jgi:hypothetical protein